MFCLCIQNRKTRSIFFKLNQNTDTSEMWRTVFYRH